MRYIIIRNISEEKRELYDLLDNNTDIKYRAKIGTSCWRGGLYSQYPEIREKTNIYDKTIRKWIHRFNDYVVCGLFTKIDYSRMIKITDKARKEILLISSISPRALGLKFSTWSLSSIAGYVKEKKIVKIDGISHTTVRDILRKNGIEWRHSKTVLDSSNKSRDPEYELKKSVLKS